jgi:hypothetical protein
MVIGFFVLVIAAALFLWALVYGGSRNDAPGD